MRSLWLAGLMSASLGAGAAGLDALQWRYHLIVVFAPDAASARQARQTLSDTPGIEDRDIAWFVLGPDSLSQNPGTDIDRAALERLHEGDGFEAVLVGKDGGVKTRQHAALDLARLFADIDAMPMRQREMQGDR